MRLGPAWLAGQQTGEIAVLATRGLDGLDMYFARYLPQLVLAVVVPVAVLARVAAADWISALVIAVTLPLIPVFAVLVGWHTKASTRRQWRLLATLAGHFLDVVEGLPTLKVFGRAKAQEKVIGKVTDAHRGATMATLRVAFLSALVLELAAAVATALVAVEVGLRLLYGHMGYETALLVLLLTPEAYLPLRAVGAQFHASMEGAAAADRVLEILDTPPAGPTEAAPGGPGRPGAARGPAVRGDQAERGDRGLPGRPPAGAGRAEPGHPAGRADRRDRAERGGQEHAAGACCSGSSSPPRAPLRWAMPIWPSSSRAWRAQIAWVPQRPTCSRAVPRTTLPWASPARAPAIQRAARLAGAAEFIEACPAGMTRSSGSRRCSCPRASGRRSRWPARSCGTRRCCCWTSPPRTWTR